MKLLFLIGDTAVGKMTVGRELMKITDLRLFHNHMTIEPVLEVFGHFHTRAILRMRDVVFEEFAASDGYGLIFTLMWAFDIQSDWNYVEHIKDIFLQKAPDTTFYYVELIAPQSVRLERNATENRLRHKSSKRDLEDSRRRLIEDDAQHRFVSLEGEIPFENYLRLENTDLPPQLAAQRIKEAFDL